MKLIALTQEGYKEFTSTMEAFAYMYAYEGVCSTYVYHDDGTVTLIKTVDGMPIFNGPMEKDFSYFILSGELLATKTVKVSIPGEKYKYFENCEVAGNYMKHHNLSGYVYAMYNELCNDYMVRKSYYNGVLEDIKFLNVIGGNYEELC